MSFILLSTNVEAKDLVRAGQGILSRMDFQPNMQEQAMIAIANKMQCNVFITIFISSLCE